MKSGSQLVVEIMPDGSLKLNATGMIGTEQELIKDLDSLAKAFGGKLTVEKHVHSHNHSHDHSHTEKHRH